MHSTPLTSYPGLERQPTFSPDGRQIAFVWNGEAEDNDDIYVKVVGAGVPLRVTTNPAVEHDPAWSPDGRHIAFLRSSDEGATLFVVPALGGSERKIGVLAATHDGWAAGGPSWSPGGRHLAIADEVSPGGGSSIFVWSTENLEKRRLTAAPKGHWDFAPAVSPDGRTVAFVRQGPEGGICIVSIDGGEPRRVASEHDPFLERLVWTPDGRQLLFSSSGGSRSSVNSLWRVSASGGTPEPIAVGGDSAANPTVSHRGMLAYEQRLQDANIWGIPLDGTTARSSSPRKVIASTRHEAGPQFSPDGARIAFHSDRSGSLEILVVRPGGPVSHTADVLRRALGWNAAVVTGWASNRLRCQLAGTLQHLHRQRRCRPAAACDHWCIKRRRPELVEGWTLD